MNCETASELLPELLVGALGREQELEVLSHLAHCEDCRRELAFWAQVSDATVNDTKAMPKELFASIREDMFGARAATVIESLRLTGRALGLVGLTCRLAVSTVGIGK